MKAKKKPVGRAYPNSVEEGGRRGTELGLYALRPCDRLKRAYEKESTHVICKVK
jgi:hypothetical protein